MKKIISHKIIIYFTALFIISVLTSIIYTKTTFNKLKKIKKEQIQFLNNNISIIPQIINFTKGYLIHNEKTLNLIIKINILSKEKVNTIQEIYNNQYEILDTTQKLLEFTKNNTFINKNKEFIKLKNQFDITYKIAQNNNKICKELSKKLIRNHFSQLVISNKTLNEIICNN